jgi:hypothetical protein
MPGPRPLAVGLIHHPASSDEIARRKTRVSLMSRADAEGFAVAEVFETDGQPVKDDAALCALESLARRIGARTVLTMGSIDRTFLTIVARRSQLMVLTMPDRSRSRSRPS